jgi:hypothetical protein
MYEYIERCKINLYYGGIVSHSKGFADIQDTLHGHLGGGGGGDMDHNTGNPQKFNN